jgi:hypothetical protein
MGCGCGAKSKAQISKVNISPTVQGTSLMNCPSLEEVDEIKKFVDFKLNNGLEIENVSQQELFEMIKVLVDALNSGSTCGYAELIQGYRQQLSLP